MSIQVITFDLDDTLWDIWSVVERAEIGLHQWLWHHYPRIPAHFSPLELRQLTAEVAAMHPHLIHDRSALRREALHLAAQRVGYLDFAVEAAFAIFFNARNDVVCYDDVHPTLHDLRTHYRIGALTNGNADLVQIGLDHLFDFAIYSAEIGASKPDPAIFAATCQRAGVAPAQIVHVGDDPDHDVQGAAQAGFKTVWINRKRRPWPAAFRFDAEIHRLTELPPVLAAWSEAVSLS